MLALLQLAALLALIGAAAAQVDASVQSRIASAYQSVVAQLDGTPSSVSFARVQSATSTAAGIVTSSIANPEAGVTYTTSTVWLGSSGETVSAPSASSGSSPSSLSGLSSGTKIAIGISVGLTALIAFATLAVLFVRRTRRRQTEEFRRRTVGLRAMSMSETDAA